MWRTKLNGIDAFRDLVAATHWQTLEQLLAAHTLFTSPEAVEEVHGHAVFPMVRDGSKRRTRGTVNEKPVYFDDNQGPVFAFKIANAISSMASVQVNHIIAARKDPSLYTNLRNLCLTPRWLAFLTDVESLPFRSLLEFRSQQLYRRPLGERPVSEPAGYLNLNWAEPLLYVAGLKGRFLEALNRAPNLPTSKAAREIGWAFSDGPDSLVRQGSPRASRRSSAA